MNEVDVGTTEEDLTIPTGDSVDVSVKGEFF